MLQVDSQQINEIAGELDAGCRAFYHKPTGQLVSILDSSKFPIIDWEAEDLETLAKIETNPQTYIEIEAMRSGDAYRVMVDFVEQLTNQRLQEKLLRALDKPKPFREFKYVIDNSGVHREEWFAFKNQQYADWVRRQLDRHE
ncbi:UPF0158 family protein [uncultured Spirosoma sp.]|uniref:UPF0158 family protein n=1 Tax=uncultured Spirosoma sp. TaxID=278208 RepID=UPI00258ECE60|nr:UPF0158 family protein [uncultured Spirosoma sp.]